jgi:hypothetical protein
VEEKSLSGSLTEEQWLERKSKPIVSAKMKAFKLKTKKDKEASKITQAKRSQV